MLGQVQQSWGSIIESEYALTALYNQETFSYDVQLVVQGAKSKKIKDDFFAARQQLVVRDGFRKGHVPRHVVEQHFGGHEAFYTEAFGEFAASKILDFCPHKILHVYDHDSKAVGDGWVLKCSVFTEHEIDDFDSLLNGMAFIMPKFDPQEQTNSRIQLFRKMNPYLHTKDGSAEDGDMVEVSITAFIDGELFEPGCAERTNIPVIQDGTQPRALYDKLLGSKAGAAFVILADNVKELSSRFADSVEGHKYVMEVVVNRVYRCEEPKLDDDLAISAGYTTYLEWHAALLQAVTRMCAAKEQEYKQSTIIDYLLVKSKHPRFPDNWVVEKIERLNSINRRQVFTSNDFDKVHDLFRSITIIALLGKHLSIQRVEDEDDQVYARRVIDDLVENRAKFTHVDPNTSAVGGRDPESSSTAESPHAPMGA